MSDCSDLRPDPMEVARGFTPVLKALADEHRLAILLLLAERPRTVVELSGELGIAQTLTSHHLKALRDCAVVTAAPEGRANRYSICCDAIADPIRALSRMITTTPTTEETR